MLQYSNITILFLSQMELKSLDGEFNNARKIDQNVSLDIQMCSQSQKMLMLQKNKEVIIQDSDHCNFYIPALLIATNIAGSNFIIKAHSVAFLSVTTSCTSTKELVALLPAAHAPLIDFLGGNEGTNDIDITLLEAKLFEMASIIGA